MPITVYGFLKYYNKWNSNLYYKHEKTSKRKIGKNDSYTCANMNPRTIIHIKVLFFQVLPTKSTGICQYSILILSGV